MPPCPTPDPAGARPGERRTADLDIAELLVVSTLRAWQAPRRAPDRPHPDWRELLGLAGLAPAAGLGFELLMSVLSRHAVRGLELRCCPCAAVGADEEAMLALMGALQRDDALTAVGVLGDWLGEAALPAALRGAERFARLTAAAGWALPPPAPPPARLAGAPAHLH